MHIQKEDSAFNKNANLRGEVLRRESSHLFEQLSSSWQIITDDMSQLIHAASELPTITFTDDVLLAQCPGSRLVESTTNSADD